MMTCYPALTIESDRAFWVPKLVFEKNFNQKDFILRNSIKIEKNYSTHWFYTDPDGKKWFYLPTVNVVCESTQFINGRHRTALLYGEMEIVPIAFAEGDAQEFASRLTLVPMVENEPFKMPEFPEIEYPEW